MFLNKKAAQKLHAKKRARQRFNVEINKKDYNEIIKGIQSGKFPFVKSLSNRLSVFKITLNNTEANVLYDKSRKTLVTFMPTDWQIGEDYVEEV